MVRYVDFKDILQTRFKNFKNICVYTMFDWLSVSFRYAVKSRLVLWMVCLSNRRLLCGSLHLDGGMMPGCEFIVMKFCLMNKEKALRSVLAITHVYVVKLDSLCFKI